MIASSVMTYKNHCKKCGTGLLEVAWVKTQPEFCKRCHPNSHWITAETLEKLQDVPSAYRKLVALDILDDLPMCGDVEVFRGDRLFYQRELFESLSDNPHLQAFAESAGGDSWCWTTFRCAPGQEPEILRVEDPWRVIVYAPSFETFMYRLALEDAAEKPSLRSDVPAERVAQMASFLRKIERADLAADLEDIVQTAELPKDGGPPGPLIDNTQLMQKLSRFLGEAYVDAGNYRGHVDKDISFLKTGGEENRQTVC